MIAAISLFYFFCRYAEFNRTIFVIIGAFFLYYVIFVFLPVTGPQYYYLAAGMDNIANGIFPDVKDYFLTHDEMLTMPGYSDGVFYQFIVSAHEAGERPTAAFPSSHIGIGTVLMFLAWRAKSRPMFYTMLPLYILMCMATVYIRAHYAIDVIAGWLTAIVFYITLQTFWTVSKRQY
jgi:membrane-associated phospholipid phosphatase